jgi:hypothetical protein
MAIRSCRCDGECMRSFHPRPKDGKSSLCTTLRMSEKEVKVSGWRKLDFGFEHEESSFISVDHNSLYVHKIVIGRFLSCKVLTCRYGHLLASSSLVTKMLPLQGAHMYLIIPCIEILPLRSLYQSQTLYSTL